MVPSGKYHSPREGPLGLFSPLQQLVLTLIVLHTREDPGSGIASTPIPIPVMSTVSPGRYSVPFKVKYSPVLGDVGPKV